MSLKDKRDIVETFTFWGESIAETLQYYCLLTLEKYYFTGTEPKIPGLKVTLTKRIRVTIFA